MFFRRLWFRFTFRTTLELLLRKLPKNCVNVPVFFSRFLGNYAENYEENNPKRNVRKKRNTLRDDECFKKIQLIGLLKKLYVYRIFFWKIRLYDVCIYNRVCVRVSVFFFLTIKPVLKHFISLRTRLPVI